MWEPDLKTSQMSESDGCEMPRGFPDQALDTNKCIIEYIMLRMEEGS